MGSGKVGVNREGRGSGSHRPTVIVWKGEAHDVLMHICRRGRHKVLGGRSSVIPVELGIEWWETKKGLLLLGRW